MNNDKMITGCEEFGMYESAVQEVAENDDINEGAKRSRLNDLLFVFHQRGCKAACDVRGECEKMIAGNLSPEMIEKIPAARSLGLKN